jgi:hypothetical protein
VIAELADIPTSLSNQLDKSLLYPEDADRLVCSHQAVRCHGHHMKAFYSEF